MDTDITTSEEQQAETSPSVLLVDDDEVNLMVTALALRDRGFLVTEVPSGEAALENLRQQVPDIVVLDAMMPGLNGFQATRQLARDPDTSAIPVVMVSTKSQETDRVWAMRQGARGYLTKPIDERLLLQTIRQVLDGKPG